MVNFPVLSDSGEREYMQIEESEFKLLEGVRREIIRELEAERKRLMEMQTVRKVLSNTKKRLENLHKDLENLKEIKRLEQDFGRQLLSSIAPKLAQQRYSSLLKRLNVNKQDAYKEIETISKNLSFIRRVLSELSSEETADVETKIKINKFVNSAISSLRLYAGTVISPNIGESLSKQISIASAAIPKRQKSFKKFKKMPIKV